MVRFSRAWRKLWWCMCDANDRGVMVVVRRRWIRRRSSTGCDGGRFSIKPLEACEIERRYRETAMFSRRYSLRKMDAPRVTESLNSGVSGGSHGANWRAGSRSIWIGRVLNQAQSNLCPKRGQPADHPNAKVRYIGDLTTTFLTLRYSRYGSNTADDWMPRATFKASVSASLNYFASAPPKAASMVCHQLVACRHLDLRVP